MPLTLKLQPELEAWLRQEARREGITPEAMAARHLEARWAMRMQTSSLAPDEHELLNRIQDGFSESFLQRFGELRRRLTHAALSEAERQEFLRLNKEVEAKNAQRMRDLEQIAQLRGSTVAEVMEQLRIGTLQIP